MALLNMYRSKGIDFCSLCLRLSEQSPLTKCSVEEMNDCSLIIARKPASNWLCAWCGVSVHSFRQLRRRAWRAYSWLHSVATEDTESGKNKNNDQLIAELKNIQDMSVQFETGPPFDAPTSEKNSGQKNKNNDQLIAELKNIQDLSVQFETGGPPPNVFTAGKNFGQKNKNHHQLIAELKKIQDLSVQFETGPPFGASTPVKNFTLQQNNTADKEMEYDPNKEIKIEIITGDDVMEASDQSSENETESNQNIKIKKEKETADEDTTSGDAQYPSAASMNTEKQPLITVKIENMFLEKDDSCDQENKQRAMTVKDEQSTSRSDWSQSQMQASTSGEHDIADFLEVVVKTDDNWKQQPPWVGSTPKPARRTPAKRKLESSPIVVSSVKPTPYIDESTTSVKEVVTTDLKLEKPKRVRRPKTFSCLYCQMPFKDLLSLRRHVQTAHDNRNATVGIKPELTSHEPADQKAKQELTGQKPADPKAKQGLTGHEPADPKAKQELTGQKPADPKAKQELTGHEPADPKAKQELTGHEPSVPKVKQELSGLEPADQKAKEEPTGSEPADPKAKQDCPYCDKSFGSYTCVKRHIQGVHENTLPRVACPVCNKTVRRSVINTHIRSHDMSASVQCKQCDKLCKNQRALDMHVYRMHRTDEEALRVTPCTVCRKMMRPMNMPSHMRSHRHTGLTCAACGDNFTSKRALSEHTLGHLKRDEWRFECHDCGKTFPYRANITDHIRLKHTKTVCRLCNEVQENVRLHRAHVKLVHGIEPVCTIFCDICGMGFNHARKLTQHRRTHSAERPYACEQCGARYMSYATLWRHVQQRHRDAEPPSDEQQQPYGNKITTVDPLMLDPTPSASE